MTPDGSGTARRSVVIVEDDTLFSSALKNRITEVLTDCDVHELDIAASPADVCKRYPALVILDWFADSIFEKPDGQLHWRSIWEEWFTPIVVVSAGDIDAIRAGNRPHPFVRYVKKGPRTIDDVVELVRELLPSGSMVLAAREELTNAAKLAANEALTRTLPLVWESLGGDTEAVLKRTGRRQLAAILYDESMRTAASLLPWETYVVPPVGNHLATGDILSKTGDAPDAAESYRVVLTPTCDLANNRVQEVLVGQCRSYSEFCNKNDMSESMSRDKKTKRLTQTLTHPESGGYAPLPGFPSKFPPLAVSLRELALLPLASIAVCDGDGQRDYARVCSTDSPFREWVAWAYLRIGCRPGVPDRDFEAWAREIMGTLTRRESSNDTQGG